MRSASLVILALVIGGTVVAADERLPVPAAAEVEKSTATVKDVFKAEYTKTSVAAKTALAAKLLENALNTKDDAASKFVLLRESRDVAAASGNVTGAMKAADALLASFDITPSDARVPAFDPLNKSVNTAVGHTDFALALLGGAEEAIAADDPAGALKFARMASTTAVRGKDTTIVTGISNRVKELDLWQKDAELAVAAIKTLKDKPEDPEANLLAGRYYCFFKGEWETGLPLLFKGSDTGLKALAEKELTNPTKPEDALILGDAWFERIAAADKTGQRAMRLRSHYWYTLAAPDLNGISKTKAEKRLDELDKQLNTEIWPLWGKLRAAIKDKQYVESPLCGGAFGKNPFTDIPTTGGILIGFHYSLDQKGFTAFDYFQPIYLTPSGEKLGKAYGNARPANASTMKAKKGQAISGLTVRGGGAMDGFSMTFTSFDRGGWGRGDPITTKWVGGNGGSESKFGFDGSIIVGVHGKFLDDGRVGGLGVITIPPGKLTPKK